MAATTWTTAARRFINPGGSAVIQQTDATAAVPVLTLQQSDVSEELISITAESAADNTLTLADAADLTTPGAIEGWIKIKVLDEASSGGINTELTDYWIPFYATPTA